MRKILLASIFSLVLLVAFAPLASSQIAKEGTFSVTQYMSGKTLKAVPMGEEHFCMSYEQTGVVINDTGEGFAHNASLYCLGSLYAVKGVKMRESGVVIYTDLDGDKMFQSWKTTSGKLGAVTKGTATFVGGTGKYTGLTGDLEWTYSLVHSAAEGTFQGICKVKGKYKLP
jgi:hypothetical protein